MDKGYFITFEGCEGVGKTTQVKLLKEYLEKNNPNSGLFKKINADFLFVREPGGTDIGEQIRTILLNKDNVKMSYECEALLYAASRMQIVKEVIMPALISGKTVICDRYIDSSVAYQGYARGLGKDYIYAINSYMVKNCMPSYTIFLNLNPEDAFLRKGGADSKDRLENENISFHKSVYNGYIEQMNNNVKRFINIIPSGDKYDTHNKIVNALFDKGIIKN